MGRQKKKKSRGPRDNRQPERMHWTPLQQSCGCVVEWGWDGKSVPPPAFTQWCLSMLGAPCPWHGSETGETNPPQGAMVRFGLPTGGYLHVQQVREARRELGLELTRQARELHEKLMEDGDAGVLKEIPAKYQRVMRAKGFDPVETWLEMRGTDIFLNLGRATMTDEMIETLPEPGA